MSRIRLTVTAIAVALLTLAVAPHAEASEILVLDLRHDPLDGAAAGPVLFEEGPGSGAFAWDPDAPPAWSGDGRGSLLAEYDSLAPTSRVAAPLHGVYTQDDDFFFGAILTVRSGGYAPDPFGFHPITFSLVSSVTTGYDRTGDLTDFRADTFDSLDFAWFPQVSPLFGGPYLSPGVFGSAVGPGYDDAFANFAFASGEVDIPRDVPHLVTLEHLAAGRELVVTLYTLGEGGRLHPVDGGRLVVDLSGVSGFAVDTLAVSAFEDGFNIFSSSGRSLHALVDYHRLFFGEGTLAGRGVLRSILGRAGIRHSAAGPGEPSSAAGSRGTRDRSLRREAVTSGERPRP